MKPSSLPSAFIASVIDTCPETSEKQKLVYIGGAESGGQHLTIVTRGKTTAWRHTIVTEEVDVDCWTASAEPIPYPTMSEVE